MQWHHMATFSKVDLRNNHGIMATAAAEVCRIKLFCEEIAGAGVCDAKDMYNGGEAELMGLANIVLFLEIDMHGAFLSNRW